MAVSPPTLGLSILFGIWGVGLRLDRISIFFSLFLRERMLSSCEVLKMLGPFLFNPIKVKASTLQN